MREGRSSEVKTVTEEEEMSKEAEKEVKISPKLTNKLSWLLGASAWSGTSPDPTSL